MGIIGSPRLTMGARAPGRHPGLGLAGPVRAFAAFPCVRSDNTAPRGRARAGIGYTELPAPCGSCHVVTRRPCSLGAVYTASCGAPHPCAPISTSHHHRPAAPTPVHCAPDLRPIALILYFRACYKLHHFLGATAPRLRHCLSQIARFLASTGSHQAVRAHNAKQKNAKKPPAGPAKKKKRKITKKSEK